MLSYRILVCDSYICLTIVIDSDILCMHQVIFKFVYYIIYLIYDK